MATLTFNDWIVGPNTTPIRKYYPGSRTSTLINFGTDISGYSFETEYRVFVADAIAFDRSGEPNFTQSSVLGYFNSVIIAGGDIPAVVDASIGTLNLIYPADMYTGKLLSGSRNKPVISVVTLKYTNGSGDIDHLRFPLLIAYQPSIEFGDPTAEIGYTAI